MPHSDSAQATANQVGLAVRSGTPRSTYDGGSLDRHRYRRLDAGGRHRDDGHALARSEVPLELSIQVPASSSSASSTLGFRDHESISARVQRVTSTPRSEKV